METFEKSLIRAFVLFYFYAIFAPLVTNSLDSRPANPSFPFTATTGIVCARNPIGERIPCTLHVYCTQPPSRKLRFNGRRDIHSTKFVFKMSNLKMRQRAFQISLCVNNTLKSIVLQPLRLNKGLLLFREAQHLYVKHAKEMEFKLIFHKSNLMINYLVSAPLVFSSYPKSISRIVRRR